MGAQSPRIKPTAVVFAGGKLQEIQHDVPVTFVIGTSRYRIAGVQGDS